MCNERMVAGRIVGALDVGSNTIKLTVARGGTGGIAELVTAAETVRLGAGLARTGRLAGDRIEAALVTLGEFERLARDHGAARFVGVATDATRRAANGTAFLDRVREETSWELRVISGDEEAALTFQGLATETDLAGLVLVADIGGGSTELIQANEGSITNARSLALGSGTLTDALVRADPPTESEIAALVAAATATLDGVRLPSGSAVRLIVLGGTGEYMTRLVDDADHLDTRQIATALRRCRDQPSARLAAALGIPPARARVLPAGVAIVRALADRLDPEQIDVARSGIRAGLLLQTFAEMTVNDREKEDDDGSR